MEKEEERGGGGCWEGGGCRTELEESERRRLTEAAVVGEELGERVTLGLAVAAAAAVAPRRHADGGRAQVIGRHHRACEPHTNRNRGSFSMAARYH